MSGVAEQNQALWITHKEEEGVKEAIVFILVSMKLLCTLTDIFFFSFHAAIFFFWERGAVRVCGKVW